MNDIKNPLQIVNENASSLLGFCQQHVFDRPVTLLITAIVIIVETLMITMINNIYILRRQNHSFVSICKFFTIIPCLPLYGNDMMLLNCADEIIMTIPHICQSKIGCLFGI